MHTRSRGKVTDQLDTGDQTIDAINRPKSATSGILKKPAVNLAKNLVGLSLQNIPKVLQEDVVVSSIVSTAGDLIRSPPKSTILSSDLTRPSLTRRSSDSNESSGSEEIVGAISGSLIAPPDNEKIRVSSDDIISVKDKSTLQSKLVVYPPSLKIPPFDRTTKSKTTVEHRKSIDRYFDKHLKNRKSITEDDLVVLASEDKITEQGKISVAPATSDAVIEPSKTKSTRLVSELPSQYQIDLVHQHIGSKIDLVHQHIGSKIDLVHQHIGDSKNDICVAFNPSATTPVSIQNMVHTITTNIPKHILPLGHSTITVQPKSASPLTQPPLSPTSPVVLHLEDQPAITSGIKTSTPDTDTKGIENLVENKNIREQINLIVGSGRKTLLTPTNSNEEILSVINESRRSTPNTPGIDDDQPVLLKQLISGLKTQKRSSNVIDPPGDHNDDSKSDEGSSIGDDRPELLDQLNARVNDNQRRDSSAKSDDASSLSDGNGSGSDHALTNLSAIQHGGANQPKQSHPLEPGIQVIKTAQQRDSRHDHIEVVNEISGRINSRGGNDNLLDFDDFTDYGNPQYTVLNSPARAGASALVSEYLNDFDAFATNTPTRRTYHVNAAEKQRTGDSAIVHQSTPRALRDPERKLSRSFSNPNIHQQGVSSAIFKYPTENDKFTNNNDRLKRSNPTEAA